MSEPLTKEALQKQISEWKSVIKDLSLRGGEYYTKNRRITFNSRQERLTADREISKKQEELQIMENLLEKLNGP